MADEKHGGDIAMEPVRNTGGVGSAGDGGGGGVASASNDRDTLPVVNPAVKPEPASAGLHPAIYIFFWITTSTSVIMFNKHLLDKKADRFPFPILLTSWHLSFATLMTQILARATPWLDSRKKTKMTGRIYLRAIVPIGVFFSLSLICGNITYMYLSVAFIQMLKACTPVSVLLISWAMGLAPPNLKVLFNVSVIVIGIVVASFGEIHFVLIGVLFQAGGVIFESTRLLMMQRLLSSAEYKMDPLVSLFYFAPICAIMNFVVGIFAEMPYVTAGHIERTGLITLLVNAMCAFFLNVAIVMLMGKTSSLVITLCGVLKDIIIVTMSAVWFHTTVTPLQFFGYSISLGGLVVYQLGLSRLREAVGNASMAWAQYGVQKPVRRRLIVMGLGACLFLALLIGFIRSGAHDYARSRIYGN